jgi:hypothetical protein
MDGLTTPSYAPDCRFLAISRQKLVLAGIALHEGDYARARSALLASLPVLRAFGWRKAGATALTALATVALAQEDDGEAERLYTEALAPYADLGDQWLPAMAWLRSHVATLALERGD